MLMGVFFCFWNEVVLSFIDTSEPWRSLVVLYFCIYRENTERTYQLNTPLPVSVRRAQAYVHIWPFWSVQEGYSECYLILCRNLEPSINMQKTSCVFSIRLVPNLKICFAPKYFEASTNWRDIERSVWRSNGTQLRYKRFFWRKTCIL